MVSDSLVAVANLLQGCLPLLSLTAYVPQWRRILRTKSSRDISIHAWLLWCVSGSIALFYAVVQYLATGQGVALVISAGTLLAFVFITTALVYVHRHGNTRVAQQEVVDNRC